MIRLGLITRLYRDGKPALYGDSNMKSIKTQDLSAYQFKVTVTAKGYRTKTYWSGYYFAYTLNPEWANCGKCTKGSTKSIVNKCGTYYDCPREIDHGEVTMLKTQLHLCSRGSAGGAKCSKDLAHLIGAPTYVVK